MKYQKLLHFCQNTAAHNGHQHGFYVKLGKVKLTAKVKQMFRRNKIIPLKCPQCKSRDVKIGKLYTVRVDG